MTLTAVFDLHLSTAYNVRPTTELSSRYQLNNIVRLDRNCKVPQLLVVSRAAQDQMCVRPRWYASRIPVDASSRNIVATAVGFYKELEPSIALFANEILVVAEAFSLSNGIVSLEVWPYLGPERTV